MESSEKKAPRSTVVFLTEGVSLEELYDPHPIPSHRDASATLNTLKKMPLLGVYRHMAGIPEQYMLNSSGTPTIFLNECDRQGRSPNWQCVCYQADIQIAVVYEGWHIIKIGPTTRIQSGLCGIGYTRWVFICAFFSDLARSARCCCCSSHI